MTDETNQPHHHSVDTDKSSSTIVASLPEDSSAAAAALMLFEHTLEPGDHVIRWEMLPIVYPIQIHAIVLETGPNHVQIADFGLTTHAVNNKEEEEEPNATTETTNQKPILDDAFSQKVEDVVAKAREKLRPKEKRRLHVVTIREQKELSSWKKVNYGGNLLFGGGAAAEGGNSKSWWNWGSKTATATPSEDAAASCSSGDVMASTTMAETSKIVTAEDNALALGSCKLIFGGGNFNPLRTNKWHDRQSTILVSCLSKRE